MGTRIWAFGPLALPGAIALGFMALAACDGAPSANPARAHAAGDSADRRLADGQPEGGETRGPARYSNAVYTSATATRSEGDTPLFHGKPLWAANKRHTAQENADYQYKKSGEALGAANEDDFLTKVHAFVEHPPKGTEVLTRANGDKLMYDKGSNLFAVVDKDGAPRTLFKPDDGAAYWDKQKDDLKSGDDGYRSKKKSARRSQSDDNG